MSMQEIIYQNTLEWKKKRLGKVTASRVADILPLKSGKYSTKRATYLNDCVKGRLGIMPDEVYVNKDMQHGTDTEPLARAMYEQLKGYGLGRIQEIDIIDHPYISNFSSSPDGLIDLDGQLEIKCPTSSTQLEYFIEDVIDEDYITQMASQLACSGRKYVDFFSFDNRVPKDLDMFLRRYERDDKLISFIENEVIKFNVEVDRKFEILKQKIRVA